MIYETYIGKNHLRENISYYIFQNFFKKKPYVFLLMDRYQKRPQVSGKIEKRRTNPESSKRVLVQLFSFMLAHALVQVYKLCLCV